MLIFPAIDLRGGRVVRLTNGDYGKMKIYGDSPLDQAKAFEDAGASHIHLVDLDSAKDGGSANSDLICAPGSAGSYSAPSRSGTSPLPYVWLRNTAILSLSAWTRTRAG